MRQELMTARRGRAMATVECTGCGHKVSTQSITCSDCGTPIGYSGGTQVQQGTESIRDAADKFSEAMRLLGDADDEGAVAAFTDSIALNPKQTNAYRYRALAYRNLRREQEADSDLETLASMAQTSQQEAKARRVGRARQREAIESRAHAGAAPPYRRRQPVVVPKEGFFESLFDMSFTAFITTRIVKFLYILAIVVAGLMSLALVIGGARSLPNEYGGVFVLFIAAPLFFLISVIFARVVLESIIVMFRIAEHAAEIADQGQGGSSATNSRDGE